MPEHEPILLPFRPEHTAISIHPITGAVYSAPQLHLPNKMLRLPDEDEIEILQLKRYFEVRKGSYKDGTRKVRYILLYNQIKGDDFQPLLTSAVALKQKGEPGSHKIRFKQKGDGFTPKMTDLTIDEIIERYGESEE